MWQCGNFKLYNLEDFEAVTNDHESDETNEMNDQL